MNPGIDPTGSRLYQSMSWLPRPPADFVPRCRAAVEAGADLGTQLQALASYALDENDLHRVANLIKKARDAGHELSPLLPFRLGILSNSTTDFIVPTLIASAARHGIALECVASGYGQVMQEVLSKQSEIKRQRLDAILIALDYRGYPLAATVEDADAAKEAIEAALGQLQAIWSGFRTDSPTICIVQNVASPAETLFGSLDEIIPGTLRGMIHELNQGIAQSLAAARMFCLM